MPDEKHSEETTTVYTDGACSPNPGRGGWGWIVIDGEQGSGNQPNTTNNRMEMTAVIQALRSLPGKLLIKTDSQLIVNCFAQGWWQNWESDDYHGRDNADLWKPIVEAYKHGRVEFEWVKGHAGIQGNEAADRLAVEAMERLPRPPRGSGPLATVKQKKYIGALAKQRKTTTAGLYETVIGDTYDGKISKGEAGAIIAYCVKGRRRSS